MSNAWTRPLLNRREFVVGLASAVPTLLVARAARAEATPPGVSEEIGHNGESIHQEGGFRVNRKRVFESLIDENQFGKLTGQPTRMSREPGSSFSLFARHITGRHVELESPARIVQAWRAESWPPHVFSIVRFEIVGEGDGTRLHLDHTSFPTGLAESLASGWKEHYWAPLAKSFA